MPPEALAASMPAPPRQLVRETVDFSPDLSSWAVLAHDARPSVADHNPASVHWRDLTLDPDLTGVAPTRARHAEVAVGFSRGAGPWRLPQRTLLCAGLAWHPRLPLVAGLVQQGHRLHPWTADYADRRVTVHEQVRAAVSLSSMRPGRAALAWCGERELALLTAGAAPGAVPGSDVATDGGAAADAGAEWTPSVYEATGPGHVAFLPGLAELLGRAGVSVSVLAPDTGELRTLSAPLLVGALTPSPTGERLLVEHATAAATGSEQPSQGTGDVFGWSRAVLSTDDASWTPVSGSARWMAGGGGHGDTVASSTAVAGGTGVRLRPLPGPAGTEEEPPVAVTLSHASDDPPLWWRCVDVEGEPVVVSRHRGELRLGVPGADFGVPLPSSLGRLGACAAAPGGVLVACVQDGRAGFLRFDRGRRSAQPVLESPGDVNAGPLESSWASPDEGTQRLVTRRGGRFAGHVLRGDRLAPSDASSLPAPLPSLTSPSSSASPPRGSTAEQPAFVLPAPPVGESARLTLINGDGTDPASAGTAAQLLWIHVRRSSGPPAHPDALPHLSGPRSPAALLDLPLSWPADADVACVQGQILHAVDHAVAALRERHGREGPVVVGGHSFAATVALHALAHRSGLAGAIAHSGCYNRTLTPEGFQYERRSYWQAPQLYRAFSALDFADGLKRPVLLVHGADDTNTSTPPDQAVALYRAVVATGGRARLVLLPHEGHSFRYRESLEAVTREHDAWLAACSTGPDPRPERAAAAERS